MIKISYHNVKRPLLDVRCKDPTSSRTVRATRDFISIQTSFLATTASACTLGLGPTLGLDPTLERAYLGTTFGFRDSTDELGTVRWISHQPCVGN